MYKIQFRFHHLIPHTFAIWESFISIYILKLEFLQIYSEIVMARKGSGEKDQQSVDNMLLLLATIYESARLLPAGPFLQRCSLKHGEAFLGLVNSLFDIIGDNPTPFFHKHMF